LPYQEITVEEDSLKDLTRRDFFTGLCSKDTLKDVFGAWNSFTEALVPEGKSLSCEEAGLELGRKIQKMNLRKISQRKEGQKI